jgi:phospholipid-binding lipoprotein MlaA
MLCCAEVALAASVPAAPASASAVTPPAAGTPPATASSPEAVAPATTASSTASSSADDTATTAVTSPTLDEPAPLPQPDAFVGFNRAAFSFNQVFDDYFFRPLATFYNNIMPKPLNRGIHNVYLNIGTIPIVVNDLLQLHFCALAHDTWRMGVNTTLGIGGLFDVANTMQLKPYVNDFGLTLNRWGYAESNYLVIPFFGSFTVRDGLGFFVDYFAFSIYPYINPPSLRYEIYALGALDRRASYLRFQSVMEAAALDKYIFIRNLYFQRRAIEMTTNEDRTCGNEDSALRMMSPEREEYHYI